MSVVSSHTGDSKPVKQGVNGTVILPPLVFLIKPHFAVKIARGYKIGLVSCTCKYDLRLEFSFQEFTLTDDTVLEEHLEDPRLTQMKLLGDGGEKALSGHSGLHSSYKTFLAYFTPKSA